MHKNAVISTVFRLLDHINNKVQNSPPAGTEFQNRVWQILLTIPYGITTTYGTIARQLGSKMSAQAVGQAVGKNPISIIIPCHRVVGAKGQLTGYAGGLEAKLWLLQHEEETK